MKSYYFDYAATAPMLPEALRVYGGAAVRFFGNPSSAHQIGQRTKWHVDQARLRIAKPIHGDPNRVVFTSGGTESNNLALHTLYYKALGKTIGKPVVITTAIEHSSVYWWCRTMAYVKKIELLYVPVDSMGRVDLKVLESMTSEHKYAIVSIMMVNNETGVIQDVKAISDICQRNKAYLHMDAVQAYGKIHIDLDETQIDALTGAAHKFGGPRGIGFVHFSPRAMAHRFPLMYGGGQEYGWRPGTENVPGIAAMGRAAEIMYENIDTNWNKLVTVRQKILDGIKALPDVELNSPDDGYPGILNLYVKGCEGELLVYEMNENGVCVSAGSACSANTRHPSRVLRAMGHTPDRAGSSIRISYGPDTADDEIDALCQTLNHCVPEVRRWGDVEDE